MNLNLNALGITEENLIKAILSELGMTPEQAVDALAKKLGVVGPSTVIHGGDEVDTDLGRARAAVLDSDDLRKLDEARDVLNRIFE